MSRERQDAAHAGQRLAVWFGPERVALVLSVLAVIALAFVLQLGPFAPAPGSPSASSSPAPSDSRGGSWDTLRSAVRDPTGEKVAGSSIAGRPAGTQS